MGINLIVDKTISEKWQILCGFCDGFLVDSEKVIKENVLQIYKIVQV